MPYNQAQINKINELTLYDLIHTSAKRLRELTILPEDHKYKLDLINKYKLFIPNIAELLYKPNEQVYNNFNGSKGYTNAQTKSYALDDWATYTATVINTVIDEIREYKKNKKQRNGYVIPPSRAPVASPALIALPYDPVPESFYPTSAQSALLFNPSAQPFNPSANPILSGSRPRRSRSTNRVKNPTIAEVAAEEQPVTTNNGWLTKIGKKLTSVCIGPFCSTRKGPVPPYVNNGTEGGRRKKTRKNHKKQRKQTRKRN